MNIDGKMKSTTGALTPAIKDDDMIVYLSYSMSGGLPENMKTIEGLAMSLREKGIIVLDPARHGFPEGKPELREMVIIRSLRDVDDCDLMIVFYDRPSVGQSCEMFFAQAVDKPILLMTKVLEENWSYWLHHLSSAYTSSIMCAKETVFAFHQCQGDWHQMCEMLKDKTWFHVIE